MNPTDFINKWLGKGIDYDGAFGFQCFDVANQWIWEATGKRPKIQLLNAGDIFNSPDKIIPDGVEYECIENSYDAYPEAGDIIVWKKNGWNGWFGHVALVKESNRQQDNVTVLQQDGLNPTHPSSIAVWSNWQDILGWIRLKNTTNVNMNFKNDEQNYWGKLVEVKHNSLIEFVKEWNAENPLLQIPENNVGFDFVASCNGTHQSVLNEKINKTNGFTLNMYPKHGVPDFVQMIKPKIEFRDIIKEKPVEVIKEIVKEVPVEVYTEPQKQEWDWAKFWVGLSKRQVQISTAMVTIGGFIKALGTGSSYQSATDLVAGGLVALAGILTAGGTVEQVKSKENR